MMIIIGDTESVRVLIEHGANVNVEDDEKWTPLHRATSDGKQFLQINFST